MPPSGVSPSTPSAYICTLCSDWRNPPVTSETLDLKSQWVHLYQTNACRWMWVRYREWIPALNGLARWEPKFYSHALPVQPDTAANYNLKVWPFLVPRSSYDISPINLESRTKPTVQ